MTEPQPPLELWGGMECTINRVHDTYFDQLQQTGHLNRVELDLESFAQLGLTTLRAALHWERFEASRSWRLFDTTLAHMRRLQIDPIVGLVHHGSGPPHTSLVDAEFPAQLAAYALKVAQRYPWVTAYTPVNEPHTTARFSGLYGHWYPHHRSTSSYLRALVNEIKATILSMEAIRTVQPAARLIYTEDGGRTSSTPELEAERQLREDRRWLGTDLLCGLVGPEHPLYDLLTANGISSAELDWFGENPCPPNVLGLNYYLTSDRFLDHRLHLYPAFLAGGDTGLQPLVDIEALRVMPSGIAGASAILLDAWERYRLPVAITECHIGDNPDNQIRWFAETWQQALDARSAGAEVVAVTTWALLGSFDWCTLCTREQGIYEPGAFSVANPTRSPLPTPMADLIRQLASGLAPSHPALSHPGWWQHHDRITFPTPEEEFQLVASSPRTRSMVSR